MQAAGGVLTIRGGRRSIGFPVLQKKKRSLQKKEQVLE
jgi:hypothetical protein